MSAPRNVAPLTEELLPQVLELEKRCFSMPWSREAFLPELCDPDCCWLVLLEGDLVLGYLGFRAVLDEGYISNVAVSPDHRRQGAATTLLRTALREAERRDLSFLTLEVRAGNAGAIRLYSSLGFRQVGVRPGYYERPREDALLMTKFLQPQERSER